MLYRPMVSRGVRLAPLVALALAAMAGSARAQMGTGWTEFFPMKNIQLRGAGAKYTNENGIETFSTQPGDERAEARIVDDHRTGTWQFEGWVNVKAGVSGGCIHQVFKFLMIVAYPNDGGEFRQHSYQRLAATGMYDKWVRVNTIHDADADAGRADVYIDGTWRGMTPSNSPGPEGWYHKYGIYNSSGTRPVVQWRNVRFFKGGKGGQMATASDGGPPAPPPSADGGSPDLRIVDMGGGADTGGAGTGGATDGAGGTGGTGAGATGGGGSGGGAGAGGATAGSGGSPPNTTGGSGGGSGQSTGGTRGGSRGGASGGSTPPVAPDPASAGCGCRVDGTRENAALALPLALGLLALAWRRRRR